MGRSILKNAYFYMFLYIELYVYSVFREKPMKIQLNILAIPINPITSPNIEPGKFS